MCYGIQRGMSHEGELCRITVPTPMYPCFFIVCLFVCLFVCLLAYATDSIITRGKDKLSPCLVKLHALKEYGGDADIPWRILYCDCLSRSSHAHAHALPLYSQDNSPRCPMNRWLWRPQILLWARLRRTILCVLSERPGRQWGLPSFLFGWYREYFGVKSGGGLMLINHLRLLPVNWDTFIVLASGVPRGGWGV